MEKIIDFIKRYDNLFILLGLLVICYFIFVFNIGNYALMDVDETRYVSMARDMYNTKDFLTLYLNGDYFFEKPPLYFWGECLSFLAFGKVNEFTARFPVTIYGIATVLLMYFTGKKIVSRQFGLISALILATTLEFVILAKFAILDIVVTSCIGFSVLFGFLTQFVQEQNKKYFWWLFYIFSGLAVMAKGIPGFVVPFAVMFFVTIFNRSFKEIFKPQYILVGFCLFLLIVIPWHVKMFQLHNPLFFDEYIMTHHINRFFSSDKIHRAQPFWFYFATILWGLVPWILSGLAVLIAKCNTLKDIKFKELSNSQKYFWFNVIGFAVTMLFFSSSKTKLITYILPVYFFTASMLAYVWDNYISNNENKKYIDISVYVFGILLIIAALAASFAKFYLPEQLYIDIYSAQWFSVSVIGLTGIFSIYGVLKNKPKLIFTAYVLLITIISAFGTKIFYNIDYKFGQNDLMQYAKLAKENNRQIAVINGGRKYSVCYYYGNKVNYLSFNKEDSTIENSDILFKKDTVIIVRNKDLPDLEKLYKILITEQGRKFSIVRFE